METSILVLAIVGAQDISDLRQKIGSHVNMKALRIR